MNKRFWMILGIMYCWMQVWFFLGFLLFSLTGIWQFLILIIVGIYSFNFPRLFEMGEYY